LFLGCFLGALTICGDLQVADYKGVVTEARAGSAVVYRAGFNKHLGLENPADVGCFCTAEEAARAYDDAVRKAGRRVVNFPRPGTDEVQAVKGEKEKVTLLRHAGKLAPPRSGPLPLDPGYKGVYVDACARNAAVFAVSFHAGSVNNSLGRFCTAEEAARAYDDAARGAGRRVVNFPRPDTDEVQAVKGESEETTLLHAAGTLLPPCSSRPVPPAPDYKGVAVDVCARTAAVFVACFNNGARQQLGRFFTAEDAARAYDDAARKADRRVVNFPRPGTDEVQALKGELDTITLARHAAAAAQQAAGGACAAGSIAPVSKAPPSSKRRATAPPPSEPPRKRATVPSVKSETPSAVAPERPLLQRRRRTSAARHTALGLRPHRGLASTHPSAASRRSRPQP
jgi:hypothetical protein